MDSMELTIEIALSLLLGVTIFYSIYLSRALSRLRADRSELNALIASLDLSSTQAQSGIEHLRQTTERVGKQLTGNIEEARALKAELVNLCKVGETMANRLERGMQMGRRSAVEEKMTVASQVSGKEAARPSGKGAAERAFLQALRLKQG